MAGTRIDRGRLKNDNPFHFNGRCKVCGDSAQSKSKARFHMRTLDDTVMCSCFNCGLALPIGAYLKMYEPDLFADYKFERYRVNGTSDAPVIKSAPESTKTAQASVAEFDLPLVSEMPSDSVVCRYVKSRKLPEYPFYYAEKFVEFSSQFGDELDDSPEGPRLIIPFYDKKGNIYAYQGRDLTGKSKLKYLSVIVDKRMPLMFGLDRVDVKKPIIIVEGPLDSLFLPNSIASVNAGLLSTAKKLKPLVNSIPTLVFDNEPRNKVIVEHYETALKAGYKVVIWPETLQHKDINEMVLAGLDPLKIIQKNTHEGLLGIMQFNKWKRI